MDLVFNVIIVASWLGALKRLGSFTFNAIASAHTTQFNLTGPSVNSQQVVGGSLKRHHFIPEDNCPSKGNEGGRYQNSKSGLHSANMPRRGSLFYPLRKMAREK